MPPTRALRSPRGACALPREPIVVMTRCALVGHAHVANQMPEPGSPRTNTNDPSAAAA
jgi:hypothetical protein